MSGIYFQRRLFLRLRRRLKNLCNFYFIFDCRDFFLSMKAKSIHTMSCMDKTSLHQLIDIQRCQTLDPDVVSLHFSHNRFVDGVSP